MHNGFLKATVVMTLAAWVAAADTKVWLDELDVSAMGCRNPAGLAPQLNRSARGAPLTIGGKAFKRGVGVNDEWSAVYMVNGSVTAFEATVGVDDDNTQFVGYVEFQVYADNRLAATSGRMKHGQPAKTIKADLTGCKTVTLSAGIAYWDEHHGDWCDAVFTANDGTKLTPYTVPQLGILTPPEAPEPRINGARVLGARPGNPVFFKVPATGVRPLTFGARNLPDGVSIDSRTGIIAGTVDTPGTYTVTLTAENAKGRAQREWRLVIGERIALTPPMGWNSWHIYAKHVSDDLVRRNAKAMHDSGLIDHGWTYVNIDEGWTLYRHEIVKGLGGRDAWGRVRTRPCFPDMKALADYIHSLGLKAGLYSSPGPTACAGSVGSWQYEWQDARSYADWGFDYLKYDWCSYTSVAQGTNALERTMRPFALMGRALRGQQRDIVFSANGARPPWAESLGVNCWRTEGDIKPFWTPVVNAVDKEIGLEKYAGPGHWNDLDMMLVGEVGFGGRTAPTYLTPNEQYVHISYWCLLAAPMLLGCDLARLDAFTRNLLTNDEVLDVHQDPLGCQASRVWKNGAVEVWSKYMEDGSLAVGLFNRGFIPETVSLDYKWLQIDGKHRIRDLWRQEDIGVFCPSCDGKKFVTELPGHGVRLVRLYPVGR